MLEIIIPETESYDSINNLFITIKRQSLKLEHSLVSLHKWEMRHHKPLLSKEQMSTEEMVDYIRCMTITQNVDPLVYTVLTKENINEVNEYIADSMTATWFSESDKKKKGINKEIITAEIIYYWMIALNIPMECQKWHLNSLLTLIQVCNIKNTPPKKMSKAELYSKQKAINEANRARFHTKG